MHFQFKFIWPWALRALAALILLQTLYFKFTAAEESVFIFSRLGMEPWGRIGIGIAELIASILILIPATTAIGAALGTGIMAGAIFFHLTKLGIVVLNDHGQLFLYSVVVITCCIILSFRYRTQFRKLLNRNTTAIL